MRVRTKPGAPFREQLVLVLDAGARALHGNGANTHRQTHTHTHTHAHTNTPPTRAPTHTPTHRKIDWPRARPP